MIFLLLACQHTPPKLYPEPFPRVVVEPMVEVERRPGDVVESTPLQAGDVAPGAGVLLPRARLGELMYAEAHLPTYVADLDACYAGRTRDRVTGQYEYGRCSTALHEAGRREEGLRLALPVVAVVSLLAGLGAGVAYNWADGRR